MNGIVVSADRIEQQLRCLSEAYRDAKIELDYTNPYTLLVAVVLSAQSTDRGVNRVTPALFSVADSPEAMLRLGEERLISMIRTLGLFRSKARHILALSDRLLRLHGGLVPRTEKDLCALPGVGIKTAKVVLGVLDSAPVIAVDTHVHRLANRLGFLSTKTPLQTQARIEALVPLAYRSVMHHAMVLHGRHVCQARRPRCEVCCVAHLCPSRAAFDLTAQV